MLATGTKLGPYEILAPLPAQGGSKRLLMQLRLDDLLSAILIFQFQ